MDFRRRKACKEEENRKERVEVRVTTDEKEFVIGLAKYMGTDISTTTRIAWGILAKQVGLENELFVRTNTEFWPEN